MRKSLAQVPIGVWVGAIIVLASAWTKDGWGFVLGAIVIAATMVTSAYRPEEEDEKPPEDDGWGTDAGSGDDSAQS